MKSAKLGFISFLCMLLLTGCWDKKELNEVAVVMGVGLDKMGEKEYRVTAQVIKPSPPKGGGTGGSELPTWSISATGITVMDAIRDLNRMTPRRLYWPHLQLIAFGEDLAKEGVAPVITWFERDRDSRSGTFVVVTKGRAVDLLNQKIELGNVPANAMAELLETSELRQIDARKVTLRDLTTNLSTPGIDTAVDVVNPKSVRDKVETYELFGMAVLKRGKLAGYITGPQTIGWNVIRDQFSYGTMTIPSPNDKGTFLTFQVTDLRNELKPVVNNGQVTLKIDTFIEGNLADQTGTDDLLYPEQRMKVEEAVNRQLKEYIESTFRDAAGMKADIYGVGKEVRRYYPDYWHSIQKDWPDRIADVNLDINVDTNIRRIGLIVEPTIDKMK